MNWLRTIFARLFCAHDWIFLEQVKDQNQRMGYEHLSEVWTCTKCGRYETRELQ